MKKPSAGKRNARPLSIGLVYDDSLDGSEGVAHQVKLIGSWLAGRGHKVNYFCGQTKARSYGGGRIYSLARNLPVTFNGNKMSIPLPANRRPIKAALAEARPDVLHVQMPHSPFMAQRVVNQANAAVVGTFHIYPANWVAKAGSKLLKQMYGWGLGRFDEIVSVSPAAQQFAKATFDIDSQIIPNCVDTAALANKTKSQPATVVFLGRLVERKGCEQLIRAFADVLHLVPQAQLVVGGDGPLKAELVKLTQQLGLASQVKFAGFVAETAKADFLAQATVACFPSLYGESFGIVLIEAMAAGAGVVLAGNNPGYASVMAPQPDLLVDPRNTQQLTAKLADLLANAPARKALHTWQSDYVRQFDINQVGHQLEDLYVRAIAKHRPTRHN